MKVDIFKVSGIQPGYVQTNLEMDVVPNIGDEICIDEQYANQVRYVVKKRKVFYVKEENQATCERILLHVANVTSSPH